MPYDQHLAQRLRSGLAAEIAEVDRVREVKMFGGLSFMVDDTLALSASNQGDLLVRVDPDRVDELLDRPGAAWAEMRNRRMNRGWLRIGADGFADDADLSFWISAALDTVERSDD